MFKRRIISTLIALVLLCVVPLNALANTNVTPNVDTVSDTDLFERVRKIAEEKGIKIVELPSDNQIFDEVPMPGYSIPSKENPKPDNDLVLPMSGDLPGDATRISVNSTVSAAISPSGDVDWFVFNTTPGAGAYNIYTTGSIDTYGEIYKKNIFGQYVLIDSDDDDGDGANFRLDYGLNASTDYYIKVRHYSVGIGNYSLRVQENLNTQGNTPAGGTWIATNTSPAPSTTYIVQKITYLTTAEANAMYIYKLEQDQFSIFNVVRASTVSAAADYLVQKLGILKNPALWLATFMMTTTWEMLSSLDNAAFKQASSSGTRGVKVTSVLASVGGGIYSSINVYDPWTSSTITGQSRYWGYFDFTSPKTF